MSGANKARLAMHGCWLLAAAGAGLAGYAAGWRRSVPVAGDGGVDPVAAKAEVSAVQTVAGGDADVVGLDTGSDTGTHRRFRAALQAISDIRFPEDREELLYLFRSLDLRFRAYVEPGYSTLWEETAQRFAAQRKDSDPTVMIGALSDLEEFAAGVQFAGFGSLRDTLIDAVAGNVSKSEAKLGKFIRALDSPTDEPTDTEFALLASMVGSFVGGSTTAEDALELLERIASDDLRAAVEPVVLRGFVERDPAAAIRYFLRSGAPADWDGELIAALFGRGTAIDPEGVSQLIDQAPPSRRRDAAIREMVSRIALGDPKAAQVWAGQIGDPAIRADAEESIRNAEGQPWRDAEYREKAIGELLKP